MTTNQRTLCDCDEKKPRLFYWEDAVDAWVPVPELLENVINTESFTDTEETIEIQFKRFDMTDEEFANIPVN